MRPPQQGGTHNSGVLTGFAFSASPSAGGPRRTSGNRLVPSIRRTDSTEAPLPAQECKSKWTRNSTVCCGRGGRKRQSAQWLLMVGEGAWGWVPGQGGQRWFVTEAETPLAWCFWPGVREGRGKPHSTAQCSLEQQWRRQLQALGHPRSGW